MPLSRITTLRRRSQHAAPENAHSLATQSASDAPPVAHAPSPESAPQARVKTPPPQRYGPLRDVLFTALDIASAPDATSADDIMTRFEALRYWVPQFKAWKRHPKRIEAFFAETAWPPLDPVTTGVLVGLAYKARSLAGYDLGEGARAAEQRFALAKATHLGLLAVPGMASYAAVLTSVEQRECKGPLPPQAVNATLRTASALSDDLGPQPQEVLVMQQTAYQVFRHFYPNLPYKPVRPMPAPIPWEFEPPDTDDAAHLPELQSGIVSFIQYHNRENTGCEIVQNMRKLIRDGARTPALLAHLHFSAAPMGLRSDFLAGALVGTLYLGLLHGLRDLQNSRRHVARTLAFCKFTSARVHAALAELQTAIGANHWGQLDFIVRTSLDAGVQAPELRARIAAYVKTAEDELKATPDRSEIQEGLMKQWHGVEWRLLTNPVMLL